MKKRQWLVTTLAAFVLGLGPLGLLGNSGPLGASTAWAQQVVLPDFSELAERVGPSVVNIRTLERASSRNGGMTLTGLKVSMQSVIKRYEIGRAHV